MSTATSDVAGTIFDSATTRVSRTYAEALLNAAAKSGEAEAVVAELEEIQRDVFRPNPQFGQLLDSPSVPASEKERILGELFDGRAMPMVANFLKVLNRHGRLGLLPAVTSEARNLWDTRQNRKPVAIRSAVELDDSQKSAVVDKVAKMIGATPIPTFTVDADLVGGLVIQVGDDLYDASLRTKLVQMRRQLIDGMARKPSGLSLIAE